MGTGGRPRFCDFSYGFRIISVLICVNGFEPLCIRGGRGRGLRMVGDVWKLNVRSVKVADLNSGLKISHHHRVECPHLQTVFQN